MTYFITLCLTREMTILFNRYVLFHDSFDLEAASLFLQYCVGKVPYGTFETFWFDLIRCCETAK